MLANNCCPHKHSRLALVMLAIPALMIAACSATAPKQIAVYPTESAALPIAREPYHPNHIVVHNAYLEFEVTDVDAASEHAVRIAVDYGGYLSDSQTWYQDSRKYATVVLAVPVGRYDEVRQALADLGHLISERVSSDPVPADYDTESYVRYSHITLQLQPAPFPILTSGWNPIRTFERAFAVIATVFQFVADVMIWIVVVGGPFVLLGWLLWLLVRLTRKP